MSTFRRPMTHRSSTSKSRKRQIAKANGLLVIKSTVDVTQRQKMEPANKLVRAETKAITHFFERTITIF